jgi:predicted nucleotidyltransferase
VSDRFEELLEFAQTSDDVLGLFVFGSRATSDSLGDESSDYDVAVVLRDGAVERFDERWPYAHGAVVEVARSTLDELRAHGEYDTASAWARPLYADVDLRVDKTGEMASILQAKQTVPEAVRDRIVREGLDGYVNSTYRALRYSMVGAGNGSRLDASESLPPLLTALFAFEGRVRPFNKYLERELATRPVAVRDLLPRLVAVLEGDLDAVRALFRDVEHAARERGFGEVIDSWEPDLAWLRGDAPYRAAQ